MLHRSSGQRQSLKCRLALAMLTALLGVLLFAPAGASAHARLVGSDPPAGTGLVQPPDSVALHFSEPVGVQFSALSVVGASGTQVELGALRYAEGDDKSILAPFSSPPAQGRYVVIWRAVSAVDGHVMSGSFSFTVGTGGNGAGGATPSTGGTEAVGPVEGVSEAPSPVRWVLRVLFLMCAALLAGCPLFVVLVLEPASQEHADSGRAIWSVVSGRTALLCWFAALLVVPVLLLDLMAEVAMISGLSWQATFSRSDLTLALINSTRYGFSWAMKVLASLFLAGLFAFAALRRANRREVSGAGIWELGIAAGSLLLLAESLGSHGAAADTDKISGLPLPVISDWLHLVTASTWVSGLCLLGFVLFPVMARLNFPTSERRNILLGVVPRFSALAVVSVAALAVTGIYNLGVQSTDAARVLGSAYGQVLGAKVLLFVVLFALGAVNFRIMTPRLRSAGEASTESLLVRTLRGLRRNVLFEVVIIAAVLSFAGALTMLPPPAGMSDTYMAENSGAAHANSTAVVPQTTPTTSATSAPLTAGAAARDYVLSLTAQTSGTGAALELRLKGKDGSTAVMTDVLKVILRVSMRDHSDGPIAAEAKPIMGKAGDVEGWRAEGDLFPLDGNYLIVAVVQRTRADDVKGAFAVSASGGAPADLIAEEYAEIAFSTRPAPPVVGLNTVSLTIKDANGAPVSGDVRITVAPEAKPTESRTFSASATTGGAGIYIAQVQFDRAGAWIMGFAVSRGGRTYATERTEIDVTLPGSPVP